MNFTINDVLSALQGLNSMPMTSTATSGYNLANTAMTNQNNLANKSLDQQMQEFQNQLAFNQAQQQYNQLMGTKQFNQNVNQQNFENQLASQQANLYKDPAYLQYIRLTNPSIAQGQTNNMEQLQNMLDRKKATRMLQTIGEGGIIPSQNISAYNYYTNLLAEPR